MSIERNIAIHVVASVPHPLQSSYWIEPRMHEWRDVAMHTWGPPKLVAGELPRICIMSALDLSLSDSLLSALMLVRPGGLAVVRTTADDLLEFSSDDVRWRRPSSIYIKRRHAVVTWVKGDTRGSGVPSSVSFMRIRDTT